MLNVVLLLLSIVRSNEGVIVGVGVRSNEGVIVGVGLGLCLTVVLLLLFSYLSLDVDDVIEVVDVSSLGVVLSSVGVELVLDFFSASIC